MIFAMLAKCKTKENMFEMEALTGILDSEWVIRRVKHFLIFLNFPFIEGFSIIQKSFWERSVVHKPFD